jgi:hypothetical protein
MHLAVAECYQPRWTADIHAEWMRNVQANRPDLDPAKLARTRDLMNAQAEGSLVEDYEWLIPTLTLPDSDDRHVLAAAITAEAQVIVTFNLSDFPATRLAPYEIIAQAPDPFICGLFDQDPDKVCLAVQRQRQFLRNPPKDVDQHLETLEQNRLPQLVARLRPLSDRL